MSRTYHRLETHTHHAFGDLKAGDKFILNGRYYEKVSGNTAEGLVREPEIGTLIEVDCNTTVFLTEVG